MIYLAKASSTIRDYLTYLYGWGYVSPHPRGEAEIKQELEHQLRRRKLTTEDVYNSDYFSDLIFHRTSPAWKKWSVGFFFITLLFLVGDVRYSVDLYEDHISTSPYFSLSKHRYDFADVETASRECTLGKYNGQPYPYLSYNLNMIDGRKINLFSLDGNGNTPHLDAIERVLPSLEHVKILPTTVDTALVVNMEPTFHNCIKLIRQTKNNETSARTISLFERLDN